MSTATAPIRFTKVGSDWGLKGPGLVEGENVTVTKKDGSTSDVVVGVIMPGSNGELATIKRKPRTQRAYRGGCDGEPCRCTGMEIWNGECLA